TITRTLKYFNVIDLNGDGLKDLVIFQNETFFYYLQTPVSLTGSEDISKRFAGQPNGLFALKFLQTEIGQNELNAAEVIFTDIDRNGLPDLVISSIRGKLEDFTALTTRIIIWLATTPAGNGSPVYPDTPIQIINLKGICPLLRLADVNGDGDLDLITSSFRTDIKANLRKAVLHYVDLNYQVYFFRKNNGLFSKIADYDRKMNFPMDLAGRGQKYFSHVYLQYDFDNDGRTDLLRVSGPDKKRGILTINKGHPKERLINQDDISFEKDEYLLYPTRIPQQVLVEDLNRDGKKDIIMVYRSRIIILTSKP
ncbi:MAG: VCBS repeat-containing protein, partial [Planctomycetota bacterium]